MALETDPGAAPENPGSPEPAHAERELRIAYNSVIDMCVSFFWDHKMGVEIHPEEVIELYRRGLKSRQEGRKLAAERWARAAKHLARAMILEAKIAYLEPQVKKLEFLEGASPDEYGLRYHTDVAVDLLESAARVCPPGMTELPEDMHRYFERARAHLKTLEDPGLRNELLRIERIKAVYEFARTLELMNLAYEAEPEIKAA